jgi:hypothetical protein
MSTTPSSLSWLPSLLKKLPGRQCTASVFTERSRVLCRYGAMDEVVTDQGSKVLSEFHRLLEQALFVGPSCDQCWPPCCQWRQERGVQLVKRALRRRCHDTKVGDQWDEELPWIMLGYNCSAQSSTNLAPYELMHAQSAAHCSACCEGEAGCTPAWGF